MTKERKEEQLLNASALETVPETSIEPLPFCTQLKELFSNSSLMNPCESFDQSEMMTVSSDSDSGDSLIGHEDLVEDFLNVQYSFPITLTVD